MVRVRKQLRSQPQSSPTSPSPPKKRGRPKGSKNKPKTPSPPTSISSPPKKRGRPKGSKNKPKVTPSPAPSPSTASSTVITDPQVVAMPPTMPQPTSKTTLYGIDVSGMKKKEVRGQTQYETKKGTFVLFPEINITREITFLNVVRRIEEVVKQRNSSEGMKLVFKVKEVNREEKKVPSGLVLYAQKGVLPGSYPKTVNGVMDWYWETVTYMVEHSEFEDSKFEYIGQISMAGGDNDGSGDWNFVAKYYDRTDSGSPSALGGSKAWQEYEPISAKLDQEIRPQIDRWMDIFQRHSMVLAVKKFPYGQADKGDVKKIYGGSCYCYKCNPNGDERWRGSANLYLATQDIKNYRIGMLGKKEDSVSYIDIPKGTLIPMGGGCEYSVNPIDIELVTSLYGDSRIKSVHQNTWQNPYGMYGWGFKQMDMRAYLTRVFAFYNKKLETALKIVESQGKLPFLISDAMVLDGGITYKALNPYQLDQFIDSGASSSGYNTRTNKEYRTFLDKITKAVFPVPFQRGQKAGQTPDPKGIFDNKSSFLLEARYFEYDGKHWLQPVKSKDGGIEDFIEGFEAQKDDPEFFIEMTQPMYNEDGIAIIDANGDIMEEDIKLPNPKKLQELYALSGGIKEVYSPAQVKKDIEDAIEFLEDLDVSNMPPILDKYFKSQQILNPRKQLTQIDGVGKKENSHKDAASIWKIYKIFKLNEMRKESYEDYLAKIIDRKSNQYGVVIDFEFLTDEEEEIYENIESNYQLRQPYIANNIDGDDINYIKEVYKMTDYLYRLNGKQSYGIFYSMPVDWERVKEINQNVQTQVELHEKQEEELRQMRNDSSNLNSRILSAFRYSGGYVRYGSKMPQINIPSQGESYTNEEVFSLLDIRFDLTNDRLIEVNDKFPISYASFDSFGLVTSMVISYTQVEKLKDFFNAKQMANLGIGQAPSVPTISTTPTTTTTSYSKGINSSEREQLERDIKKTKFPEEFGEDVKGYIYSVSPKTYNRPFDKDTKYVGVITANNDDSNLDGHFLNFPYKASELTDMASYYGGVEGTAVIMQFKTLSLDTGWYRTQTKVSKVNMRRD